jgi:ureidoglycolate hydrolase
VAHGGQAVTYAPGTWHAPMVVLVSKRRDAELLDILSRRWDVHILSAGSYAYLFVAIATLQPLY